MPFGEECEETANILSTAGVELKNMLTILKMTSSLLLPYIENMEDPRLGRHAAMLHHCFYTMLRLTNNISELGAILRNDIALLPTSYDIVASGRELISSAQHLIRERGVKLRFVSNKDSLFIYADRIRVDTMLLNLLADKPAKHTAGRSCDTVCRSSGDGR